ncbi:hypothetical protein Sulku_2428 [Sulfuricurvum kujiense DSM 16994]|uniref:Uncharacterized protein n=1 Tax=Sulfuricurvum kujiense (strain ATCC BAA-921 / DSM 16994 / JCM 11577 / YK-1) TaxID=709032 RepID=E4TYE2_SULKY|nr:hypothetical protein [Sulfuricurvum kujiense]ADR35087.1 hypothetical protein Sulku_2428 [Sulfuricurvum kujiense DSM 16994]
MIIEILKLKDVDRVDDMLLREYLEYSLRRLPDGFDYFDHVCEYGYFCIVTELDDLMASYDRIPSIDDESFWERVELIEEDDNGVLEILVRFDTDFMVSLIFRKEILRDDLHAKVLKK